MKRVLRYLPWSEVNTIVVFFLVFLGAALLTIALAAVMQTPTPLPAAGAFTTMAAMMVIVRNQQRKDEIDRSKFYLESARDGFDQAVDMLRDNFIRVRWIAAARMLIYSQQLADSITETEHCIAFKIIRDDLRHRLSDILGYRGTGLRGSAFYGAPDEANIDEAARASTRRSDNDGHSMSDNRTSRSQCYSQSTALPNSHRITTIRFRTSTSRSSRNPRTG